MNYSRPTVRLTGRVCSYKHEEYTYILTNSNKLYEMKYINIILYLYTALIKK